MPAIFSKYEEKRLINPVKFFFQRFYTSFEKIIKKHLDEQSKVVERTSFESAAEMASAVVEVVSNPSKLVEKGLSTLLTVTGEIYNSSREKEVRQGLVHVMEDMKVAKKGLKKVIAQACLRIFQIYGNIFINCHVQGSKIVAMEMLAEVALASVVVHIANKKPEQLTVEFIIEAIQNIDHKNYNIFKDCVDNLFSGIKSSGNIDTNKISIGSSSEGLDPIDIFFRAGVTDGQGNFYEKLNGRSNSLMYGNRLCFPSEDLDSAYFCKDLINGPKFLASHKIPFQSLELYSNEDLVDEILDSGEKDLHDVIDEIRAWRPNSHETGESSQSTNGAVPKTEPAVPSRPKVIGSRKMFFKKNNVERGSITLEQREAAGDAEMHFDENAIKDVKFDGKQ